MRNTEHVSLTVTLLTAGLIFSPVHASLDLLAGVEAGIETETAMTNPDLERTQQILSTQQTDTPHRWLNPETGIAYQININRVYSYGNYPCLAYELSIFQDGKVKTKALDACQHQTGKWISVSPIPLTL